MNALSVECDSRPIPRPPAAVRRGLKRSLLLALALAFQAGAACAAGDAAAGKAVFVRCASCHQVGPGAHSGFGPQLNAIFGRPAAADRDFRYSPALSNSKIVWSESSLRAFIKAPNQVVPGNKMRFYGIGDEQKITDLLAYLRSFQQP